MILLDVVDAEQNDPLPPEMLASFKAARTADEANYAITAPATEISSQHHDGADEVDAYKVKLKVKRRILRIVKYTVLVYFALFATIAIPLFVTKRVRWRRQSPLRFKKGSVGAVPGAPTGPHLDRAALSSSDGQVIQCNPWIFPDDGDSSPRLLMRIPANETIHLYSFASDTDGTVRSAVSGNLRTNISDDAEERDVVISITQKTNSIDAHGLAAVCLFRRDFGWSVSIYVPGIIEEGVFFELDVDVVLPQTANAPHLYGFTTNLPSFNQTFNSLDSYTWENFALQGSSGSVEVESVHAKFILVKTSAGRVTGKFNGTEKVILQTALAPIMADISLSNEANREPTFLSVETGNSDLFVNVTLYELAPPQNRTRRNCPSFTGELKTFGGLLNAAFFHAPTTRPAVLHIRAQNNLERAQVFVDEKFEGFYDVHTNLAEAIIERDPDVLDPSGAGRKRVVEDAHVDASRAWGWVGWGNRPRMVGKGRHHNNGPRRHIEVVSSLSPAVLQLTKEPKNEGLPGRSSKAVLVQPT